MQSPQYQSSYYSDSCNQTLDFPALNDTYSCDICVVGAGFTGISTALFLAEKGYNVAVVEQKRVGWGASGRNGGQVSGNYDGDISQLSRFVKNDELQQFWDMAEEGKDIIKQRIGHYQIQCDITPGIFHAAYTKNQLERLQQRQQQAQQYNYHAYKWINSNEVTNIVDNKQYIGGLLDQEAFHIHPLNLVLGQAKAASQLGVKIFENSPVIAIKEGKSPCVITNNAQLHCKNVVICGEGYMALSKALPNVSSTILPVSTYIIATEPLDNKLAHQLLPQNNAVSDCRHYLDFYRLSADKRLLFGGGSRYGENDPKDIINWRRKHLVKSFPQLTNTQIDYGWGGVMGFTDNNKPHFSRSSENTYVAQGFSGHGVALSHVAGKIVAQCISADNERFDLFSRIKHREVPCNSWVGRPTVALISYFLRLRDALNM